MLQSKLCSVLALFLLLVLYASLIPSRPGPPAQPMVVEPLDVDPSLLAGAGGTGAALPTVLVPGMGDACGNPGFSQLTGMVAARTHALAVCVGPGAGDSVSDAALSFLMPMDEQVEHFARRVRGNAQLRGGFNAMGLSQGNLVVRGYVHKYNDPPVRNFVSVHGPHAGVAGVPRCDPSAGAPLKALCDGLDILLGDLAYSSQVQAGLAQSNYFRDPMRLPQYREGCRFLPRILEKTSDTYRENFAKLDRLVLIMALRDTMIFPKESEHFGAFQDGAWNVVLPAEKQSAFYEQVGLGELVSAGRVTFLTTNGDHLRFSQAELNAWVDTYFVASASAASATSASASHASESIATPSEVPRTFVVPA